IKVAGNPMPISAVANWTTFTPDGKYLYISNAGQRSVSVIDVAAMKLIKAIPVGEVPKRINTMVTPDDGHAITEKPGKRAGLHWGSQAGRFCSVSLRPLYKAFWRCCAFLNGARVASFLRVALRNSSHIACPTAT